MSKSLIHNGNTYIGVSVLFLLCIAGSLIFDIDFELGVMFLWPLCFAAFYYIFKGVQLKKQSPESILANSSHNSVGLHKKAKKILLSNLIALPVIFVGGIVYMDMCGNDMGCFAGIFFAGVAMIIYLLATIVYAGKTHKKYVNNVSAPVSSLNPVAKGFFRVFMLVTILYVGSLLMATFHYYYYDWYRFDEDTGRYYSIQGRYYYYDSDGRYHKCYPDLPMEHFWNDRCN